MSYVDFSLYFTAPSDVAIQFRCTGDCAMTNKVSLSCREPSGVSHSVIHQRQAVT